MEEKKIIPLKYPIVIKKEGDETTEIKQITLGRLKLKHLEALPENFMESEGKNIKPLDIIPIVGAIAGLTKEQIGEIDIEDLLSFASELQDFLAESLASGKK
jgi:hypothetical protein